MRKVEGIKVVDHEEDFYRGFMHPIQDEEIKSIHVNFILRIARVKLESGFIIWYFQVKEAWQ